MLESHPLVQVVRKRVMRDQMVVPGDRVIVGCSGGADSVCLLHVLTRGLSDFGLDVTAVYVDHGLRENTEHEIDLVAQVAAMVGAHFETVQVDVLGRERETGESRQEAARVMRYRALREISTQLQARRIAVGHTRSDQAETVLLQLLRGAGPKGLSGIAPVYHDVIRPLIDLSRQEIEAYCDHHQLRYVHDPSNFQRDYMRNRLRLDVMPLLKSINPGVEGHLAQVADILREEERWLKDEVDKAFAAVITEKTESVLALDLGTLKSYPLGLVRRLIRAAHAHVRGDEKGLTFTAVDQIVEQLDARHFDKRHVDERHVDVHSGSKELGVFGGIRVYREYDTLLFMLEHVPLVAAPIEKTRLNVPGETRVGDALRVKAQVLEDDVPLREDRPSAGAPSGRADRLSSVARLDNKSVHLPLVVRSRRDGDRVELASGGTKKVKDLLIDAKVPRRRRDHIPIVEDQKGIIWIVGYYLAPRVWLSTTTDTILELSVEFDGEDVGDRD